MKKMNIGTVTMVAMVFCMVLLLLPMNVQAVPRKTATHFAQTHLTVQCVNGYAQDVKCALHVECSEYGHYELARGKYKSSNTSVATVDRTGKVHCTGKEGITVISVQYRGKVYRCRVSVIAPDLPRSVTYCATANPRCHATSGEGTLVYSRRLGKKK